MVISKAIIMIIIMIIIVAYGALVHPPRVP